MADDIGGLQVDFTAEASQLRGELQRMEQQLRAFDRAHGRHKIVLTADFQQPGQRRIDDMRRGIQSQLDKGAPLRPPIALALPTERELTRFSTALGRNLPAVTVKVKGIWDGWEKAPPADISMRGGGGGRGNAAVVPATQPQAGPATVRAPMATIQTGPAKPSRDEVRAAREQNRRAARTGTNVPAVQRPQSAAGRRQQEQIARASSNQARAAAQTQQVSRSELFQDWDNETLLDEYISTLQKGGSNDWLAKAKAELMGRGLNPNTGAAGGAAAGGARGFAMPAGMLPAPPRGGTSAARGIGRRAPDLAAGGRIATTIRPRGGESVANLIAQTAVKKTGTPPPLSTSMARVRSVLPQLSAGNRARGEAWYPEANKALKRMRKAYGLDKTINDAQLSSMAGIFSGNADWPQNLKLLSGVFQRLSRGVDVNDPEKFLGIGTFPDLIVKAVQVAQMNNPTMAQIAGRKDVQTGDQFLRRQQGEGTFFGPKTGPFAGALHAGGGKRAEAEARDIWQTLAPIDRWMARGIHGIDEVGDKAHTQGHDVIQSLFKKAGFSSDFAFQAGLWDFYGPAQAAATPFESDIPPTLDSAARTPPTRLTTLQEQLRKAQIKSPGTKRTLELEQAVRNERSFLSAPPQIAVGPPGRPNVAAFMNPTPQSLMVSPGEHIDPNTGALTYSALVGQGYMEDRERTPSERAVVQMRQQYNREQAAQQRMFSRPWGGAATPQPGVGIAAFTGGQGGSLADQILGPAPAASPRPRAMVRDINTNKVRFASNAQVAAASGPLATPPGGDMSNLDVPAYLRRGAAFGKAAGAEMTDQFHREASSIAEQMLGSPEDIPPAAQALIEAGRPQVDEAGGPIPSDRLLRRAGLEEARSPESAAIREMRDQARLLVTQARGAGQVRAVGTTLASSVATVFGGRAETQIAQRRIEELSTLAGKIDEEFGPAFENAARAKNEFDDAVARGDSPSKIAQLRQEFEKLDAAAEPGRKKMRQVGAELKGLEGRMGTLRQAAIGFGSSIVGTVAGLAIFGAVQSSIEAIGASLEKPIDAIGGYIGASQRLQSSLGQSTRAMHGHADLAVAAATAQAGLGNETYSTIAPVLEQRAAIQAGNEAFGEQIDLIRASSLFQSQTRAAQRGEAFGFGITPGALPGISGATGGLFGSAFGGQMPLIEQLAGMTPQGTRGQRAAFGAAGGLAGAAGGAAIGAGLGLAGGPFAPITVPGGALIGGLIGALGGAGLGGALGPELAGFSDIDLSRGTLSGGGGTAIANPRLAGFNARAGAAATANAGVDSLTERQRNQIEDLGLAVGDLSEAAVRATPSMAGISAAVNSIDAEAIAATAEAMRGWVPPDQIEALQRSGFAVTGANGRALSRRDLQEWFQSGARGAGMPSREQAARQSMLPLAAQLQFTQWQGQMQRETLIPGQAYLSQLASGRAQVGGARAGAFGIREMPQDIAREAPNYGRATGQLTELQQQMQKTAQTGRSELISMLQDADDSLSQASGSTSNLTGQFKTLETSVAANAGIMRGLQLENMWAQANLQVHQYDEQIRIANRSLDDAQSFLTGMGAGELGLLQYRARGLDIAQAEVGFRQQELGMQSQQLGLQSTSLGLRSRELQLMQSQRQINFQRSLAGFVTPGATPEEMAARQAEAKIEADFAQQQQDLAVSGLGIDRQQLVLQGENVALAREALAISREQFAVQQAMITVNAERAVIDISHQIALLTEARTVTLQVAVNNEAIAAYQDQIAADMEKIQSLINDASNARLTVMQTAASLAAAYGGTLTEWNRIIIGNLNQYLVDATALLSGYSSRSAQLGENPELKYGNRGTQAAGFFSNVSGPTQMTVGEAGPETVAILRNPRMMTLQGGGGEGGGSPTVIQVDVHDNNISSERDEDELAMRIARKVEEVMSRKSSLLGLRAN